MNAKKKKPEPLLLNLELPPHPRFGSQSKEDAQTEERLTKDAFATLQSHLGGKVGEANWGQTQLVVNEVTVTIEHKRFRGIQLRVDPGYSFRRSDARRKRRAFEFPVNIEKLKSHVELMNLLAKQDTEHAQRAEQSRNETAKAREQAKKLFVKATKEAPRELVEAFDLEDHGTDFKLRLSYLSHEHAVELAKLLTPWFEQREEAHGG